MNEFTYRGVDRQGIGRTGRTSEAPGDLVPRLYRAGWRRLTVAVAGRDDVEVGWIWRNVDNGLRVWSADLDAAAVTA